MKKITKKRVIKLTYIDYDDGSAQLKKDITGVISTLEYIGIMNLAIGMSTQKRA